MRFKGKKLESRVTLFAAIEAEQHEFLRRIAYQENRSLADVVREALAEYQRKKESHRRRAAAHG
jgi:hypothetical protein